MSLELILLCVVSFGAGFVDSIVGGGGLLQTPAMLIILPQYPVATVLGTIKIPSLSGTSFAAWRYSQNVTLKWKFLVFVAAFAFVGAIMGAHSISLVDSNLIKPIIFVILIMVAVFTFFKKNFGLQQEKDLSLYQKLATGLLLGFLIGFYDGLIGPGTGTFLILAFISLLGSDFLRASASAKLINMATNIAAIIYFGSTGQILYEFAIPMALFNIGGSILGTRLALLKGNRFIRYFFLIVVFATILRFAYDIFFP